MNPSPRPPMKLWIAFAAICGVIVAETFYKHIKPESGWIEWVLAVLRIGLGIWVAWFGIFRISGLQLLLGWMCLLSGFLSLLVFILLFLGPHQGVAFPLHMLSAGCSTVCGWLLVFDRQVAARRSQLKVEEDKRASLRAQK